MINVSRSGQHHDYLPQTHTTHIFNGRHGTVGNDQLTKGYKKFMGKGNGDNVNGPTTTANTRGDFHQPLRKNWAVRLAFPVQRQIE